MELNNVNIVTDIFLACMILELSDACTQGWVFVSFFVSC